MKGPVSDKMLGRINGKNYWSDFLCTYVLAVSNSKVKSIAWPLLLAGLPDKNPAKTVYVSSCSNPVSVVWSKPNTMTKTKHCKHVQ